MEKEQRNDAYQAPYQSPKREFSVYSGCTVEVRYSERRNIDFAPEEDDPIKLASSSCIKHF